jgi:hypothetical protein
MSSTCDPEIVRYVVTGLTVFSVVLVLACMVSFVVLRNSP